MSELPQGWAETTIGEVAGSMKNGLYKPVGAYADDGVACLRMYNIGEGKIVWKNIKRMKLSLDEIKDYQLLPGDLLVNRVNSRELVGKSAIVCQGLETCVFESKNIRVQFRREVVCPELANYALLLGGQRHFTSNAQQVVGMASISQPQIAAFPLRLPPLNEQRRIVTKLEKLLNRVNEAQARLATIPRIITRFRQSVLAMACSGRLTSDWREQRKELSLDIEILRLVESEQVIANIEEELPTLPTTWRWASGNKVLSTRQGVQIPRSKQWTRESSGSKRYLYISDFKHSESLKFVEDKYPEKEVTPDDLIMANTGSPGEVFRGVPGILSNNLFKISMVSRHFTSAFAYHYFKSPLFFSRIKLKGGAQQHLGHPAIGAHLIPIPPLLEQQEIVRRVEALFKTADALEARYCTAKANVDKLTQSILAKAFRGELVPQDPKDEPASVLLERIRKQRDDQQDIDAFKNKRIRNRRIDVTIHRDLS